MTRPNPPHAHVPPNASFGDRLEAMIAARGRLCVGIDPHPHLLDRWDLPHDAAGTRELGLRAVEAAADHVGVVKPQVAFFERFGSAGYAALERVLYEARSAGLIVIADAKRGDIGSTVDAYAQAWLTPGSPLEADALTVNPFLGVGALAGPRALARQYGKGLFVLAATSNREASEVQAARNDRVTVAAGIVNSVLELNHDEGQSVGSTGLVLGATVDFAALGIDLDSLADRVRTPVLAPGFGHQGAEFAALDVRYGPAAPFTLATASRALLEAGPRDLADAIARASGELGA